MRYLDELVLVYPGKDASTRKFILCQLMDRLPDPFSEEVADLLWRELRAPEPPVRRQARYALGQHFPAHLGTVYGLSRAGPGLWSRFVQPEAAPKLQSEAAKLAHAEALLVAAAAQLSAPIARLLELLRSDSSSLRLLSSLALSRFPNGAVVEGLAGELCAEPVNFTAAFALAELGTDTARERLEPIVRAHGPERPDLYMLLRGFPGPATVAFLEQEEPRSGAAGRANIALALANQAPGECLELLERLIRRREGWVTAHALDTLAGLGDPRGLPLIRLAWDLEPHEFIRMQAVRAAGALATAEATAFCLMRLDEPAGRVQLAALEALARWRGNEDALAERAGRLLDSPFLGTRVRAILITAAGDPERASGPLRDLVLSPESLLRLEGAYLLGYLPGRGTRALLERMALEDPSIAVRVQAVKGLARLGPEDAMPSLAACVRSTEPATIETACRAVAGLPPEAAGPIIADLEAALPGAPDGAARGAILRAMGTLAGAAGRPAPHAVLHHLADPDPETALGALKGLIGLGDAVPAAALKRAAESGSARVRARAAQVALLGGHLEARDQLAELLAAGDEGAATAARALMEIGQLMPALLAAGRHQRLLTALGGAAPPTLPGPARRSVLEVLRRPGVILLDDPLLPGAPRCLELVGPDSLDQRYQPAALSRAAEPACDLVPVPLPEASGPPTLAGSAGSRAPASRSGRQATTMILAQPRRVPPWTAVLLALPLVVWLAARGAPPAPATLVPSTDAVSKLTVFYVEGECSAGSGPPLRAGDTVPTGQPIRTAPGGKLTLLDPTGNSVWIGSDGALTLLARAGGYRVEEARGDLLLDFRRTASVTVALARGHVTLRAAQLKLHATGPAMTLTGGEATLSHGGVEQPLEPGRTVQLP